MRGSLRVKNVFDLWRENGCRVPFRVTRGWSSGYWVTVVRVEPVGEYGKVYGFGNVPHDDCVQKAYWGELGHIVEVKNAGCGGWSLVPVDKKP